MCDVLLTDLPKITAERLREPLEAPWRASPGGLGLPSPRAFPEHFLTAKRLYIRPAPDFGTVSEASSDPELRWVDAPGDLRAWLAALRDWVKLCDRLRDPEVKSVIRDPHRLAVELSVPMARLSEAYASDPGLSALLERLSETRFEAEIWLDAAVRPAWLRQEGERLAEAMIALEGPAMPLLVADDPLAIEVLSPYTRDLAPALCRWAELNPEQLEIEGLHEAVAALKPGQDPEGAESLLPWVARALLSAHPSLLLERRQAERSQGLRLFDALGLVAGRVDLSRMARPDPTLPEAARQGGCWVLAGGASELRESLASALIDAMRVNKLGLLRTGKGLGVSAVNLRSVYSSEDGFGFDLSPLVAAEASILGVDLATEARESPLSDADLRLLRAVRRQRAIRPESPLSSFAIVSVTGTWPVSALESGRFAISLTRLAWRCLLHIEPQKDTDVGNYTVQQEKRPLRHLFRA